MNGRDRLNERIARLGEEIGTAGGGWRELGATDTDALLILLLREVEETVLPRVLVIETDPQAQAALDVANGRILALETADIAISGAGDFAADEDFAVALAAGFRRFAGQATTARIRSVRSDARPDPSDLRCPAGRVAGLILPARDGADALRALVAALKDDLVAWRLFDPAAKPIAQGGMRDAIAELTAFVTEEWRSVTAQLDSAFGDATRPGCLLLSIGGDVCLICARAGDERLFLLAHPTVAARLATVWQQVFDG